MNGAEACAAMQVAIHLVLRVPVPIVDDGEDLVAEVLADGGVAAPAVGARFVDVVAGEEHEVEVLFGDVAAGREVAHLVVGAAADGKPQAVDRNARRWRRLGAAGAADLVAARRIGTSTSRPGWSPVTSTWTLWPTSGRATRHALLQRSTGSPDRRPPPTLTWTEVIGMPPPSSGFGARRVQMTTASGSGSPDATPSVKG